MTPERIKLLVDRIMEQEVDIDNYYRENPEFAHFVRLADTIGTIYAAGTCTTTIAHWPCYCDGSALLMRLNTLVRVNPQALDDIYEEFKNDFQELLNDGMIFWKVVESREYPIPPELYTHTHERIADDGLDDC